MKRCCLVPLISLAVLALSPVLQAADPAAPADDATRSTANNPPSGAEQSDSAPYVQPYVSTQESGLHRFPAELEGLGPDTTRVPLVLDEQTTLLDGPVRPDGTIDYLAAINEIAREGVTLENNAFIDVVATIPPDRFPDGFRPAVYEALGIDPHADESLFLIDIDEFVTRHRDESDEHGPTPIQALDLLDEARNEPWTAEQFPLVAEYLHAMSPALERVAQAATKPRYYAPLVARDGSGVMLTVATPAAGHLRQVAKALQTRAQQHVGEGRVDAAWADLMTIKKLKRLLARHPKLIANMSVHTRHHAADALIASLASSDTITSEQARRMIADLQALPPVYPHAQSVDFGERLLGLDAIQQVYRAPGPIVLDNPAPTNRDPIIPPIWDVNVTLRDINGQYDRMVAILSTFPYSDRRQRNEQFRQDLAKLLTQQWAITPEEASPPYEWDAQDPQVVERLSHLATRGFTKSLIVPLTLAPYLDVRTATFENMEIAALALAAYRADHGDDPATLKALTPQYLEEAPVDLFADGRPLGYKLTDEVVVLYTVGVDGEDDGGSTEPKGVHLADEVLRIPRASAE